MKVVNIIIESDEDKVAILDHKTSDGKRLNKKELQTISDYFNTANNNDLLTLSCFGEEMSCNASDLLTTIFKMNDIDERKKFKKEILELVEETLNEIM